MNSRRPAPALAAGFSLVELMVALVVALVLLAGVLQILLSNRQSFQAQRAVADVQENARFVSFFVENVIAHAGFRSDLIAFERSIFPAEGHDGFQLAAGSVVAASADDDNGNDAVLVRFQSDGNFTDCNGNPVGSPDNPQVGYFSLTVSDNGILQCNGIGLTTEQSVARMSIRYGLDTDDDDAVDAYVDTLPQARQEKVRSLRVQILLRSEDNVLPADLARSFNIPNAPDIGSDDRRAYAMVDQTIALRNLLP